VLLFGSGGVMVEVYNDVALRRCPITRAEAQAMIAGVKGARLLQGFRGRPAADLAALDDTPAARIGFPKNIRADYLPEEGPAPPASR
jgi:acyl-CoA synthetase (NDP forming)